MGAVMALGQALGLIAVDTQMVGLVREDSILIGTFLLLACLFLVGDRSPYESWGIVHPDPQRNPERPFRRHVRSWPPRPT